MASPADQSPLPPSSITHNLPSIRVKLGPTNFLLWKTRFKPLLRAYKMLDHVEGTCTAPPTTIPSTDEKSTPSLNPAYEPWMIHDQLALGWILNSIEDSIIPQLIGVDSSAAAWSTLETYYSQQNQARVMHLRNDFSSLKKENLSMIDYLNKAKFLVDSLSAIGRPPSNDEVVSRLLIGLGPDYQHFRRSINAVGTEHTMASLHSLLLADEASEQLEACSLLPSTMPTPLLPTPNLPPAPQAHFATRGGSFNRGGGGRFNRGRGGGRGGNWNGRGKPQV